MSWIRWAKLLSADYSESFLLTIVNALALPCSQRALPADQQFRAGCALPWWVCSAYITWYAWPEWAELPERPAWHCYWLQWMFADGHYPRLTIVPLVKAFRIATDYSERCCQMLVLRHVITAMAVCLCPADYSERSADYSECLLRCSWRHRALYWLQWTLKWDWDWDC